MELNNMMQGQSERAKMLQELQSYKFAAYDLGLFLDTHPTDRRAIMMYKELSRKAKELEQAFEKEYGPLSMGANQNEEAWDWVCDPWPWQHQ